MPKQGYGSMRNACDCVRDYIYKYYNSVRPYSHNLGLSPNKNNNFIGKPLTAWPKKVDHYTSSASLFIAAYL